MQSQESISQTPKTYLCSHCDAVNYFDEVGRGRVHHTQLSSINNFQHGDITDPPVQELAPEPSASFRHRYSRSPSPAIQSASEDVFCSACQRNQTLLTNILAEYLPDEDDPKFEEFLASYDAYKRELEERYPQVCSACLPRVQDQIRNAGYAARADHLRRIMDKSDHRRKTVQTSRLSWTLRLISVAQWTYIISVLVGMLWHTFGLIMVQSESFSDDETFRWDVCLSQAIHMRSVNESCVLSPTITKLVEYALIADLLTIWWNPKLEVKANSLTGRMHGLKSLWSIRIAVLSFRFASLHYWKRAAIGSETLKSFQNTQLFMLIALALSVALTWKTVRITYHAPSSLPRLTNETLPTAPNDAEQVRRGSYHPAQLQPNIFDGMAHAFTSGFDDTSALPPSPTLTTSSYTTHYTEATTPYVKSHRSLGHDSMDWTPTQRRFAQQAPDVLPAQWSETPSSVQQHTRELHSLFSQPDPNPFHHKIPAAPRAPAQAQANPWKPGIWDPPLKETTPNFFKQEGEERSQTPDRGLEGIGVPKNVKRNAEMFASPKLKYDYYGTMKDTGLEDTFNGLFSQ